MRITRIYETRNGVLWEADGRSLGIDGRFALLNNGYPVIVVSSPHFPKWRYAAQWAIRALGRFLAVQNEQ